MHGYDIATVVGREWPIDRQQACLVLSHAVTSMMPLAVNPETARGVTASYDIRVRGGSRFVVRFHNGLATVEALSSQPVDCHLSGEPVALLLVGYGRMSQWRAIRRGGLIAWGRKPWLGLKFKSLFFNP